MRSRLSPREPGSAATLTGLKSTLPGSRFVLVLVGLLVLFPPAVGASGASPGGEPGPEPGPVQVPEQAGEPGSELTVYLVTMEPGEAIWELFGHNAIWIRDRGWERDVAYNWGLFDFEDEDFALRFLEGRMRYWMAGMDAYRMMDAYAAADRTVEIQELRIPPARRAALRDFVEWNALPENRYYLYDYYRDNCSTRVRDALDLALEGLLREAYEGRPAGETWRSVTRHWTEVSLPDFWVIDVLLGQEADEAISRWDEMFIPMILRDRVRELTVSGPGGERVPLVVSEEVYHRGEGPEPTGRRARFLPFFLLASTLGAGGLVVLGRRARRGRRGAAWGLAVAGGGWSVAAGFFAGIMLLGWLATDHVFMYRNENLLQLGPLSLILGVLVPLRVLKGRAPRLTLGVAAAVAALSLLGLLLKPLPWFIQVNGLHVALALPLHLGLLGALLALGPARGRRSSGSLESRGRNPDRRPAPG